MIKNDSLKLFSSVVILHLMKNVIVLKKFKWLEGLPKQLKILKKPKILQSMPLNLKKPWFKKNTNQI